MRGVRGSAHDAGFSRVEPRNVLLLGKDDHPDTREALWEELAGICGSLDEALPHDASARGAASLLRSPGYGTRSPTVRSCFYEPVNTYLAFGVVMAASAATPHSDRTWRHFAKRSSSAASLGSASAARAFSAAWAFAEPLDTR